MTASQAAESIPAVPPSAVGTIETMDPTFIERNQIVERYLAGKLPLKGAQDFERFCREHPESLITLGLSDRINAGLRLLDASGLPEPWAEKPLPFFQKPMFVAGVAALAGTMMIAALLLLMGNSESSKRIAVLEDQIQKQPLLPAQSTRTLLLMPSRSGPMPGNVITIGGHAAELADMKIDVSWSRFTNFRVTIDRADQGRVGAISNLQKDSNGHLRIALNSSAVGPGDYRVTLEGLDWRGTPSPEAWFSFAVAR